MTIGLLIAAVTEVVVLKDPVAQGLSTFALLLSIVLVQASKQEEL